jgi:hypothetical protein
VTGVLFAASAVIYALRCRRASSRARKQAARARERQMAQTRGRQAAPTAHDVVPSPSAPPRTPPTRTAPHDSRSIPDA